jgi:hypothetical protein
MKQRAARQSAQLRELISVLNQLAELANAAVVAITTMLVDVSQQVTAALDRLTMTLAHLAAAKISADWLLVRSLSGDTLRADEARLVGQRGS